MLSRFSPERKKTARGTSLIFSSGHSAVPVTVCSLPALALAVGHGGGRKAGGGKCQGQRSGQRPAASG
jgi:hypothetical protein